jgi:hypothetical protein
MPAPAAVPAVAVPVVVELGARVVELRLEFAPQAAKADVERETIPKTVNTAMSFFMGPDRARGMPAGTPP